MRLKKMSYSTSSRVVRKLLVALCLGTTAAIGAHFVLPLRPPLPRIAGGLMLADEWTQDHSTDLTTRNNSLGRGIAAGPTESFVNRKGELLYLIPFSSWTKGDFVMEKIDRFLPEDPPIKNRKCLASNGEVGVDPLPKLIGWASKPLSKTGRVWHTFIPTQNRSYACIVIATTSKSLLQNTNELNQLKEALMNHVAWPDPPGL
jgi:hypothetical protein